MLVNNLSAIQAGVRLLPFAAALTLTIMVVAIVITKFPLNSMYLLLIGALLSTAGAAGLSQTSKALDIQPAIYGWEILTGAGLGFVGFVVLYLTPLLVDKKNLCKLAY